MKNRATAGELGDPGAVLSADVRDEAAVEQAAPAPDFVTGAHIPVDGGCAVSDRLLHDSWAVSRGATGSEVADALPQSRDRVSPAR